MRRFFKLCLLLFALVFAAASALSLHAQQTPDAAPPKPAARSLPGVPEQSDDVQTPAGQMLPDTTPLTGILAPAVGTPVLEHSFVMIGAQVGSTVQSAALGSSGWNADNYLLGNLSLVKNWRQGMTSINYSGGAYVSTDSSQQSGPYQNFSFTQNFRAARWEVSLVDAFSFLRQSPFGFGGGTNLGQPGTGGSLPLPPPGIGSGPTQNIFSALGTRYMDTGVAQASYTISAKDSVTFSGSYGLLRFTDSSNFNDDTLTGGMGYNRQLTRLDSIGLFYSFGSFHFAGNPEAFGSHTAAVAYGRKITGKIALQLSGGPQINTYRIALNGNSTVVTGTGSANLIFGQLQDRGITLSYRHGISDGSGVLIGSQMDQVNLGVSHRLTRVWTGFANFGYSRNSSLGHLAGYGNYAYNDWFLGAGLSRPFGRDVQLGLSYSADFERSNQPGCTGTACNTDFTQQMINLSLQWHTRPFVIH